MTFMVSGNNLFRQWVSNKPILERFEAIEDNKNLGTEPYDFNIKCAKLVYISWSYNIFQWQNIFFIIGSWNGNDIIKKIDYFKDPELKSSDLLAVGNDFTIYILNIKQSIICVMNCTADLEVYHLIFNIKHQVVKTKDLEVIKMIGSNNFILFLTKGGYLFSGIPPSYVDTSYCIGDVCDIDCGYDHCILLTTAGFVYSWGSSQRLQLGHGDIEYVKNPKVVEALAGLKICKIAAGGFHSLALSECGDIYVWGWNDDGQLGIFPESRCDMSDDKVFNYLLPKLLEIYDEQERSVKINVTDIACGSKHSAIKLEDNTVWTTGYNKYGQLGIPPKEFPIVKYFKKVQYYDFDFKITCGTWSTVIEKIM